MRERPTQLLVALFLLLMAAMAGAILIGELIILPGLALLALVIVVAIAATRARRRV